MSRCKIYQTAGTNEESNLNCSPSFRLSVSAQQSAFAVGVLSNLYAFHRSTEIPSAPTVLQLCFNIWHLDKLKVSCDDNTCKIIH